MSRARFPFYVLVGALLAALPACGGSGQGLRSPDNPVRVMSTSIPPALSGQKVDFPIDLNGGCGGPYVIKLIQGKLPPGVVFDNATHSMNGTLLMDGTYSFTLQIDDTGCNPFSSTQAKFTWNVGVGDVVVVDVLQDGNSALLPAGAEAFNPDYPALPTTVYNQNTSLQFVVAGGVGPYKMKLYDDPALQDGNLPLGVVVASGSPNLVGSPVEVGPGGGAFLLSFELTDAVGTKGYFHAYWKIDTPPITIATTSLGNGVCGQTYSETFFLVDGVPPFTHDLVEQGLPLGYTSDQNPNPQDPGADVLYNQAGPPTVNPSQALNKIDAYVYPTPSAIGPNYAVSNQGAPPEGIYMVEDTGALTGIPRRRGTFSINYHVQSSLVPNSFGQHAWRTYTFQISPSGSLAQDPSYTVDGVFRPIAPYSRIGDFELGQVYNPDGGVAGLQLKATGGCPQDGKSDHPHLSQVVADPAVGEVLGAYTWAVDWDPLSLGTPPIPHVELLPSGVFRVVPGEQSQLATQAFQTLTFTVNDYALPTSFASTNSQYVRTSVGPDVLVITESTTSFAFGNTTSSITTGFNDPNMKVKVMLPYSSGAVVRSLDDAKDMAGTGASQHTIPSTAGSGKTLKDLLEGVDLLRTSVNATGWWDDTWSLNPKAGIAAAHGDMNQGYGYYGLTYSYEYWSTTSSYTYSYGANPESTCVQIPVCTTPGVTEDRDAGVYTSGGKLYLFDSSSYIGAFIVRPESKVYVPIAFNKSSTGYYSFGDVWVNAYSNTQTVMSIWKVPQITISPDGRFAALKLGTSTTQNLSQGGELASSSRLVIFSLTGERIAAWGNKTWIVVQSGANGGYSHTSSTGERLIAASLALSNDNLYYVCGCNDFTSSEWYSWRYEWVYRYGIQSGGSSGALLACGDSEWTNTNGNPLQLPMQRYYEAGYGYNYGTYGYNYCDSTIYYGGYAGQEWGNPPMPFRMSADGHTVAIVAGRSTTSSADSTTMYMSHVWVDDATGVHRLSSRVRHQPWGGGRGSALSGGSLSSYTYQWGMQCGPSTQLEVADDGSRVAVVVNRYSGTVYYSSSYAYELGYDRQDVIAFEPAVSGTWAGGAVERQVTGSESATTPIFSTNLNWKFGALVFTKDGNGLVFWGGAAAYYPNNFNTSSYQPYVGAPGLTGSLYLYSFPNSTVTHILDYDEGGNSDDIGKVYPTQSTQVNPSFTDYSFPGARNIGTVKPLGGFMSPNRNFYYISTAHALSSTLQDATQLIGINVRSLDSTQAINGHSDGRAFALGGTSWPTHRSWIPTYGYSSSYCYCGYYGIFYQYIAPGCEYGTMRVMTRGGKVFYGSHYQIFGPTPTYSSYTYAGPIETTYHGCDAAFAGQVGYFDANVGGTPVMLTTLPETIIMNNYSSTTYRTMKYLEVSSDETAVAFVYAPFASTSYSYPVNCAAERVGWIGNLITNATTGAVVSKSVVADLQGAAGRISSSIAHDSTGTSVFYGDAVSGADEKDKYIYQTAVSSAGAGTPKKYSFSGDPKRYNILNAGR